MRVYSIRSCPRSSLQNCAQNVVILFVLSINDYGLSSAAGGIGGGLLQRQWCGPHRPEDQGHAVVIDQMPRARLLQRAGQRRIRRQQDGLDAVAAQILLPACLHAHGLHVLAGELRAVKVAAAVDKNTAAGIFAVDKVPAPEIFREDAAEQAGLLQFGRGGHRKGFGIVSRAAGGGRLRSVNQRGPPSKAFHSRVKNARPSSPRRSHPARRMAGAFRKPSDTISAAGAAASSTKISTLRAE